jgi:hypothetical protein
MKMWFVKKKAAGVSDFQHPALPEKVEITKKQLTTQSHGSE